jgi:hypothetical protein
MAEPDSGVRLDEAEICGHASTLPKNLESFLIEGWDLV